MLERWHFVLHGRIVATAWASDGDAAAVELDRHHRSDGLVISDTDWRAWGWRKALFRKPARLRDRQSARNAVLDGMRARV